MKEKLAMQDEFRIKSLKVDGRPVSFDYMASAKDYGEGLCLLYNLNTGIPNRFWHPVFSGDFRRLLRMEKYPQTDDKEVEVEAVLAPVESNGQAEVPVLGRGLRELIGIETADKRGAKILAVHSLQLAGLDGAQA